MFEQSISEQSMFDQIDKINLFSTEMNVLIDTAYIAQEEIKYQPIDQFSELLSDFIKSKVALGQELMEEMKKVLKFAGERIGSHFQSRLFSEIQDKPGRIDKINIIKFVRDKYELCKFCESEFINSWQSFFELRKKCEDDLKKGFKKIYQVAYAIDRDTWNKFRMIGTRLEKGYDKINTFELLRIYNNYSLIKDSILLLENRQCILEKSSQWVKIKSNFVEKYNAVIKDKNILITSLDKIRIYKRRIEDVYNNIKTILLNRELEKDKDIIRINLGSDNDINTDIFLQRLATNDSRTDNFERTEYFFEYHINHNKQTHEIDYTLYFGTCKFKYCSNGMDDNRGYLLKIGVVDESGDYNFSDLIKYEIGQYTLKEEQYKDIFLSKAMKVSSLIECSGYYLGSFIKEEQIKRLLQSMYQVNGGTDNIFIQLHDFETDNLSKGFAFANQKVIYFEEFIDNENQPSLKTIECNLVSKINDKEKFNEIFNYSGGTSFNDPGWRPYWIQTKQGNLPNANILKKRENIFRDVKNIDFTKNENFKIAKITYPVVMSIMSIVRNMDVEKAILKELKINEKAKYELKPIYNIQYGEYECMDGMVIKGKNIPTNRFKNENDQLRRAIIEFSFFGSKEESLLRNGELQEAIAESSLLEEQENDQLQGAIAKFSFPGEKMAGL